MTNTEHKNAVLDEFNFVELLDDGIGKAPLMGFGYNQDDELCLVTGQYADGEFLGISEKKITLKEACGAQIQMDNIRDEFDEHSNYTSEFARRKFWTALHESFV